MMLLYLWRLKSTWSLLMEFHVLHGELVVLDEYGRIVAD